MCAVLTFAILAGLLVEHWVYKYRLAQVMRTIDAFDLEFTVASDVDRRLAVQVSTALINNAQQVMQDKPTTFAIWVKKNHVLIAGVIVAKYKESLHIQSLWCTEHYRFQGIGSQLIAKVEQIAKQQGLPQIFVETHSFEAPQFYAKHGYKVIAVVPRYLSEHDLIYLRKDLSFQVVSQ